MNILVCARPLFLTKSTVGFAAPWAIRDSAIARRPMFHLLHCGSNLIFIFLNQRSWFESAPEGMANLSLAPSPCPLGKTATSNVGLPVKFVDTSAAGDSVNCVQTSAHATGSAISTPFAGSGSRPMTSMPHCIGSQLDESSGITCKYQEMAASCEDTPSPPYTRGR